MQFNSIVSTAKPKRRKITKSAPATDIQPRPEHAEQLELREITHRIQDLEIVQTNHDQQLRTLDLWSTIGWMLAPEDPLAQILSNKMAEWNTARPKQGGHPWGPPRRCLTFELVQWLQTQLAPDSLLLQWHRKLTNPEDLEQNQSTS
jgi:hypothetical protein